MVIQLTICGIMTDKLFYCYSQRLKRALDDNGFKPVFSGYTLKTNQLVFIYKGTKELNYYKNYVYQTERDRY